jgi:pectate lyase
MRQRLLSNSTHPNVWRNPHPLTSNSDNAGLLGISIASHKTLIGEGSTGVIKGKGLRIVSGASNIIIQNIKIEEINPKYVWGGDAITLNDCDMVWIDHVTVSHRKLTRSPSQLI